MFGKLARLFTAAVYIRTYIHTYTYMYCIRLIWLDMDQKYMGLNYAIRINLCTKASMRSSASAVAKDADRM